MRRYRFVTALLAMSLVGGLAHADPILLWDNYLSPSPGYDGVSFYSSEITASIPDSWAVDDAVFEQPVTIEALEWLAIRKIGGYTYTAEAIILRYTEEEGFEELVHYDGLSFTADDFPGTLFGFQGYEGYLTLPDGGFELDPGHYYFGTRLLSVGGASPPSGGRNMILTTGNGTIHGLTMGAVTIPSFGYPDWTFTADFALNPRETDLAYRIYGVPEPASLLRLTAGLLLARRR